MASSIQTVGHQVAIFDDADLLAVTAFIIDEVKSNKEHYAKLTPHMALWRADRACYGPGVIDLHLDDILDQQELRRDLRNAPLAVHAQLVEIGAVIPARVLNSLYPVPGVTCYDYAAASLYDVLDQLLNLLDLP